MENILKKCVSLKQPILVKNTNNLEDNLMEIYKEKNFKCIRMEMILNIHELFSIINKMNIQDGDTIIYLNNIDYFKKSEIKYIIDLILTREYFMLEYKYGTFMRKKLYLNDNINFILSSNQNINNYIDLSPSIKNRLCIIDI